MSVPFEPSLAWAAGGLSALLLLWWGWEEHRQEQWHRHLTTFSARLWQCKICAVFYTAMTEERLTICPQCGSYNSQEGQQPL